MASSLGLGKTYRHLPMHGGGNSPCNLSPSPATIPAPARDFCQLHPRWFQSVPCSLRTKSPWHPLGLLLTSRAPGGCAEAVTAVLMGWVQMGPVGSGGPGPGWRPLNETSPMTPALLLLGLWPRLTSAILGKDQLRAMEADLRKTIAKAAAAPAASPGNPDTRLGVDFFFERPKEPG